MDLDRKTAFEVLLEIDKENSYSNLTLNKFIRLNEPPSPAFVRELTYGVLENMILLDYYLDILIPSGLNKVKKREKCLLRLGLYQIMFMDSVPEYAAVNETVGMAKRLCKGRERFINGVLRGYIRQKGELTLPPKSNLHRHLAVKYSFPEWIIKLWMKQYGAEMTEELLCASNKRPQLSIRVNFTKTDIPSLVRSLENKGFEVRRGEHSERMLYISGSNLMGTEEYAKGLFSVQDEASFLACRELGAKASETVIDTCAAPGGKTSAIAEMMADKGRVIACDIYEHKLKLIEEQALRLGLDIIETRLLDGKEGDDALKGTADRVLVDAPCSGLGVIRRKPEIKYTKTDELSKLISTQSHILSKAAEYPKPGGTLVYSTCTVNRDENEEQIKNFLEKHEDYQLIYQKQFLPTEGIDGLFICKMLKKA